MMSGRRTLLPRGAALVAVLASAPIGCWGLLAGRPHTAAAPRRLGVSRRATYQVTLQLPDGQTATVPCADDEFILDAAEEAGFELPSSCRSGACTSCQGRVLSGAVSMEDQSTLEEEHIAAGYVCTCIAYPESDVTIKTHQMDNFENGVMVFDDAVVAAAPVEAAAAPPEVVVAAAPPAPAKEEPVVVATAPVAPVVAATAPVANGVALDAYKADLAKKTLAMLRDVVAGKPDLEAKCDEFAALLDGAAAAPPAAAPESSTAEYVPYRCDAVGYTIWLNKNNPRNSWYEYH